MEDLWKAVGRPWEGGRKAIGRRRSKLPVEGRFLTLILIHKVDFKTILSGNVHST